MTWDESARPAVDERTFRWGAGPTAVLVAVYLAYALLTWDRPHRPAMLVVDGIAALAALMLAAAPLGGILRSRWCGPFVVGFSGTLIVLATESAALDGGVHSPLVAMLFAPLAFAALTYPLRQVVALGVIDVLAFMALGVLTPGTRITGALVFAGALITVAWMSVRQARVQQRRREELSRMSRTDELTGALNRRGFEQRLGHALEQGAPVTLVVADLDDFKLVNDSHGHAAGDEVLRWAAERLAATAGPGGAVGRMGGDEFAVLLAGAHEAAGLRVVSALADRAPASAGAAMHPRDGDTADDLFQAADAALYTRKRATPRAARPAA